MKNEKFLLDIQTKCGNITNKILNAAIDAERTFKCKWPHVSSKASVNWGVPQGSVTGHVSNKASIKCAVPQGSVLGPLLCLIYISYLNHAIKLCKVHHFADDTNLFYFSKSVNKLNKYINIDMKNLINWRKKLLT